MAKIKATPLIIAVMIGFITYATLNILEWLKSFDWTIIPLTLLFIFCIGLWIYYIYDLKNYKTPQKQIINTKRDIDFTTANELRRKSLKQRQLKLKTLEELKEMNPYKFEDYVASIYRKLGYDVVQTKRTGDGGKDIIIKKDGQIYYVECKRYEKPIESKRMRDFIGACAIGGDHIKGIYVTTSSYTKDAITAARAKDIEMIDGLKLVDLAISAANQKN